MCNLARAKLLHEIWHDRARTIEFTSIAKVDTPKICLMGLFSVHYSREMAETMCDNFASNLSSYAWNESARLTVIKDNDLRRVNIWQDIPHISRMTYSVLKFYWNGIQSILWSIHFPWNFILTSFLREVLKLKTRANVMLIRAEVRVICIVGVDNCFRESRFIFRSFLFKNRRHLRNRLETTGVSGGSVS